MHIRGDWDRQEHLFCERVQWKRSAVSQNQSGADPWTTNDGRRLGGNKTARVMYEEYTSALLLSVSVNFPNICARQIKVSEWDCTAPSLQQLLYVGLVRWNRPWYQRSHREELCESCCTCKSFTCLLWHVSPTNTPPTAPGMQNCRGAEGIIFLLQ